MRAREIPLDQFFAGQDEARLLFEAVSQIIESFGETELRVTKSQAAFRHKRAFAWVWMPGMYQRGDVAPLVLSVALPFRDPSPRWKEVVAPTTGLFMHHLELRGVSEVDGEVLRWLHIAWLNAG